jgi:hypothetical protein
MISIKLKTQHKKVIKDIEVLEESHVLGYVDLNVFNPPLSKLQYEKNELENHLTMTAHELQNSSLFLKNAIRECLSLASLWSKLTCFGKRKLADMVFPDGLFYYRDTDRLAVSSDNLQLIRDRRIEP